MVIWTPAAYLGFAIGVMLDPLAWITAAIFVAALKDQAVVSRVIAAVCVAGLIGGLIFAASPDPSGRSHWPMFFALLTSAAIWVLLFSAGLGLWRRRP